MPDPSKTEKASPKKRRDERKKGNVFQSKDIVAVASVWIVFTVIEMLFPLIYANLSQTVNKYFGYIPTISRVNVDTIMMFARDIAVTFVIVALPIALVSMAVGIIATGAQTKFVMAFEALKPKYERIDPIKGFQKMLSLRSLVEMVKAIIKVTVIGVIIYNFIISRLHEYVKTLDMGLISAIGYMLGTISSMVINICVIFIFIAALDFIYQWWEYERNIKMSKHDVKEEYKQLEGDPKVKGKIKEKQRKISMSRMMQAVPTADVIIRNPTHYAVALKYDIQNDFAPVVVALGKDRIALKIIEVAQENDVYVVENRPLARAIYSSTKIGSWIPPEHFAAVAEVLALVYTLNNKKDELIKR